MLLVGFTEDDRWLRSQWALTYRVGWEQILKICLFASKDYKGFEVAVDDQPFSPGNAADILKVEEAGRLTFRGISNMVKVPIMITLYNQSNAALVTVGKATEEFVKTDYEKFNKSMAQYLTSIEMAMCQELPPELKNN